MRLSNGIFWHWTENKIWERWKLIVSVSQQYDRKTYIIVLIKAGSGFCAVFGQTSNCCIFVHILSKLLLLAKKPVFISPRSTETPTYYLKLPWRRSETWHLSTSQPFCPILLHKKNTPELDRIVDSWTVFSCFTPPLCWLQITYGRHCTSWETKT